MKGEAWGRILLSVGVFVFAGWGQAWGEAAAPAIPEEIVITATGRAADSFSVPAAISVYGSDDIAQAGIEDVKHLTALAPSLGTINSIGESFGQLIRMRGIATSGADIGLEPAAGVTLDGVPLSRANLAIADLQGVDKIEVLRGPQGTLFGKNATAGIVNVLTKEPDFTPLYEASVTLGDLATRELRLTANDAMVGNVLAGRVDALYATSDGYVRDSVTGRAYGGREREQVRGQLLWTPSADFSLRTIADYLHHDGTVNAPVYRVIGPTGPAIAALSGAAFVAEPSARDVTEIDDASPRFERADSGGISLEGDWKTRNGAVTAITSYRAANFDRSYDVDNSPADLLRDPHDGEQYRTFTAELRWQGHTGRLDHLVGGFFSRERIASRDSYRAGADFDAYADLLAGGLIPTITGLPAGSNYPEGSGVFDVFDQRTSDYAVFTHDIYQLSDHISLVAGLRYSGETKALSSTITTNNPGCSAALAAHGADLAGVPAALQGVVCIPNLDPRYDGTYEANRGDGNWSGVAALDGKISNTLNTYLSYSRGYKSGGFQLDRSGMDPLSPSLSQLAFGAETANSYEAGLKANSGDGLWRADAAVFTTAFHDYQFSYFTGMNRRTTNVPELSTKGVELEAWFRPLETLQFSSALTYEEAIFGRDGFPASLAQIAGTTAPIAPRWVTVETVKYARNIIGNTLTVTSFADLRWQSASNVGGSGAPAAQFMQGAYATVDARLVFAPRNSPWQIEFWARNLFDRHAWSVLNNTTLQPGSISGYVIDPRTLGVTAQLHW